MSIEARLQQLENRTPAGHVPGVLGYMDFDERGQCSELELAGQLFTPVDGEAEEELCDRAMYETGKTGPTLMLVRFVRAENGKPALGFERFACDRLQGVSSLLSDCLADLRQLLFDSLPNAR